MAIEDFIKHGSHCLAGKYTVMGRCSCGAEDALIELAELRKAAQQDVAAELPTDVCPRCGHDEVNVADKERLAKIINDNPGATLRVDNDNWYFVLPMPKKFSDWSEDKQGRRPVSPRSRFHR